MRHTVDLKVVVLGPVSVGKTSIIQRFCNNQFPDGAKATLGASFWPRTLDICNAEVTALFVDTAGEERFKAVAPNLIRGANGLVLVFDLTQPKSFAEMDDYFDLFVNSCAVDAASPPVILLANKMDLDGRSVSAEEINKWQQKNRIPLFSEVSAKDGTNLDESLTDFITRLATPGGHTTVPPISLDAPHNPAPGEACC
jgi:small GTP-binding protein